MERKNIHTKEAAKMMRKALKHNFPGIKFSVRMDGSSIRVEWFDGPSEKQVNGVAGAYSGQGFDGMIDMRYYKQSWLMPDGFTVKPARSTGTGGSSGSVSGYEFEKPHPDAELVQFYSDFVFLRRNYSKEAIEKVSEAVSRETGWEKPEIRESDYYVGNKVRGKEYSFVYAHTNEYRTYVERLQETSFMDSEDEETKVVNNIGAELGIPESALYLVG